MLRIALMTCVLLAGSVYAADDTMTEAEVIEYMAINKLTLNSWLANGNLKAYSDGGKIFFKRSEIEVAKTKFGDYKKFEAAKSTAQVNDRNFGREETLAEREAARKKELDARGAGATATQRTGADNKVDYRQAEIDKKRQELEATRSGAGRNADRPADDRQAERDRAIKERDAEKNAKRL